MANDIDKTSPHYKGEFGSIYEVNQKFPNGGVAGDYVEIDGWAHYWNADRGTWCVNAQRDSYWDELITGIIEKFKLFKGATYMGVAGLDTVPAKAIGAKMYYFATVAGTYKNFGGLVVPQGINVLYSENGSSWVCSTLLEVAQELGVSTRMVVSQKVVNDALDLKANQSAVNDALAKKADKETVNIELGKKFDKESVVQESGDSEELVMSQKAVSAKLSDLSDKISGICITKNVSPSSSFLIVDNVKFNGKESYIRVDGDFGNVRLVCFANNDIDNGILVDNIQSGIWYKINKDIEITSIYFYSVNFTQSSELTLSVLYDNSALLKKIDECVSINVTTYTEGQKRNARKNIDTISTLDFAKIRDLFLFRDNLIDISKSVDGKYCSPTGSEGAKSSWRYVDIPVEGGKKYSITGGRHMTCYYSNEVAVGNVVAGGIDTSADEVITLPINVNFVRLSFLKDNDDITCFVKSDTLVHKNELNMVSFSSIVDAYSKKQVDDKIGGNTIFIDVTPSSNLRSILEAITDSSQSKRYIIRLTEGLYDISKYYSADYIKESESTTAKIEYAGLVVPQWCKLVGIGNRENVILTWTNATKHPRISTINLYLNSELENITVISTKLRYACHDDWVPDGWSYEKVASFEKTVRNCRFVGIDNCMGNSYGSGYKSGCKWLFEDCIFEVKDSNSAALYMHNNNSFEQSAQIKFVNCRFITSTSATVSISLQSLNKNSYVVNDIYFYGCKADKSISLGEDSPSVYGAGIKVRVRGYGNTFSNGDVIINNTDGKDYSENVDLL